MALTKNDGIWYSDQSRSMSYPDHGNDACFQLEDNSFWFKYRNGIICNALLTHGTLGNNRNFVDIGGGNGFVAKGVQDLGFETTLLEPGEGAINAKSRGVKEVYCCMLSDLPPDKTFHNAGLFDVVEHIEEPISFLKLVASHLSPEGRVILTVPCYNFLWSSEDVFAGHWRRYTLGSLQSELQAAGLEVTWSSYFFSFLIAPIFLFRALPEVMAKFMGKQPKRTAGTGDELVLSGLAGFVIKMGMLAEKAVLRVFGRLPFGASLVVVAKKKNV